MGNYLTYRANNDHGVEDIDLSHPQSYRFPSKSGTYFADHFVMAGEKFENMNPEAYLFGENNDLNYLTNKPCTFPFPAPSVDEPSNAIRSLVHLRKDSLKIIKDDNDKENDTYYIEFIFDSDVECAVRIFMIATEDLSHGTAKYYSRSPEFQSEPIVFPVGAKQTFSCRKFSIQPTKFQPSELNYIPGEGEIPLVIQITVEHPDFVGQSESTFAGIENISDGGYNVKFLKQKLMVDGFCFIAQEIYGIENQNKEVDNEDDDLALSRSDNTECIICFSSLRDTLILPCRHLYLCKECAETIRSSDSDCPLCKTNFHALLQINAVRKKEPVKGETNSSSVSEYEEFPLIDAMTGNLDGMPKNESENNLPRRNSSTKSRRSARSKSAVKPLSIQNDALKASNKRSQDRKSAVSCEHPCQNIENEEEQKKCMDEGAAEESNEVGSLKGSFKTIHSVFIEAQNGEDQHTSNDFIDPSLPGTPMGSDQSNNSLGLLNSSNSSTMLLAASSHSVLSTQAQVIAPKSEPYESQVTSYINEGTNEAEESI